jgi:hypothetical protein
MAGRSGEIDGRCFWLRVAGREEMLIPMCIGAAVNGPSNCTCDVPESRIEEAERRRDEAESYVLRLREKSEQSVIHQRMSWRQNKVLRDRIRALEDAAETTST